MSARFCAAALALATLGTACSPKDPHDLGHSLVVHGIVTDVALGTALKGVKVTLLGSDGFPSTTTDERGYFRFLNVLQIHNTLIQFQMDGYDAVTATINPSVISDGGCVGCDGGPSGFPGFDLDGFDASIALAQTLALPVSGWVQAGPDAAKGATVILANVTTATPHIAYQVKADDAGRFAFASVRPGTYEIWVLPYDRDGDGVSEFQLFRQSLNVLSTAANLSNVVVNLKDVTHDVEGGSFVNLSAAYPITGPQLAAGVTGVLQSAGAFFLHFGATVDDKLTQFELVQIEAGGRASAPLPITVVWTEGVIATITPAAPLVASGTATTNYQLRIRSLRFRDGFVLFAPSPTVFGQLSFTVGSLPVLLASPTPAFYLGTQFTATQAATQAVVDANNIWLLDANGDFVFDTAPGANWGPANLPQIQWQNVPGAVRYHLFARNTTSSGGGQTATLQWREIAIVAATDPNLNPTIISTINLFTAGLGYGGLPWAFGNGVEIAVTAEDANGFQSAIDPTKLLATKDSFGGLITAVALDATLTAFPFTATVERGSSFVKSFRIDFSEAMSTLSTVALSSTTPNLTVGKINSLLWGSAAAPAAPPGNTGTSAYLNVSLAVTGACTELLLDRSAGDTIVPVRDTAFIAAGATTRVVLLNPATGGFLAELLNVAKVDSGTLTLAAGIPGTAGALVAAKGSLACALQAPGRLARAATITNTSTSVVVDDASIFSVGETVLLYEPQTGGAGQVADVRTLTGLDTTTNTLVLNANPAAGHTAATVVLPLNVLGAEVGLRGPSNLNTLQVKDIAGGPGVDIQLSAASALIVGDTVLIDADGDLKTTVDQVQVKVKAIRMAAAPFTFTVDLPPGLTLLRGRARIIALGDSFSVSGVHDTSPAQPPTRVLDPHRDQFTGDGSILF